jgi:CubicO group peptidase (beta-lactamase class C family)
MIDRRSFVLNSTAAAIATLTRPGAAFPQSATDRAAPTALERAAMATAATEFLEKYSIPGLGVAVTRHGRLAYEEAFGIADKEARQSLTIEHRFRIASVSKPITAVAIFALIEQGALRLRDRPFASGGLLSEALGSGNNRSPIDQITIEHLLTHTAGGWANDAADPMFQHPELDHSGLIAWVIRNQPLRNYPGRNYAYSNFGYCVLGRVIEAAARRPYAAFVQDAVLRRIGVDDMEISGNTLAERRPCEVRYYGQGAERPYAMNVRRMDSHGGWLARPAALAVFASHVDGLSQSQILQPTTIRQMTTASPANAGYAKGWQINRSGNWWHTGSLPGTTSIIVRTHSGFCWAALANTRRRESGMGPDLDRLLWAMVRKVASWNT